MNGRIALVAAVVLAMTAVTTILTQPAFAQTSLTQTQSNRATIGQSNSNTGAVSSTATASGTGSTASASTSFSQSNSASVSQGACLLGFIGSSVFGGNTATQSGNECS